MTGSTFKPKVQPRERRDRSEEFANFVVAPRPPALLPASVIAEMVRLDESLRERKPVGPILKTQDRKRQAIRDAARDEPCTVRIVGACNSDPATSVWAHLPGIDGDRGMAIKAFDLCGAITCSACHDVIDGRRPRPPGASPQSVLLDFYAGHMRSLVRLAQKGLL